MGAPRSIRSDEWIRFTPLAIGSLTDANANLTSQLASPSSPSAGAMGLVRGLIYADSTMTAWISGRSEAMAFAFQWWFPILLYFAFMPLWLRRLGVEWTPAIAVTFVVYFSPPNQWWSLHPTQLLGWTALASLAAICSVEQWAAPGRRRWPLAIVLLLVSGIALARLVNSYLVWVIPLAPMLLLPTIAVLVVRDPSRRRIGIVTCASAALVGASAGLALLIGVGGERYESLTSTVYPGVRRVVGEPLPYHTLLGGAFDGYLQRPSAQVINSNLSEVAGGWSLMVLALLILLPRVGHATPTGRRIALGLVLLWTFLCYAWVTLSWPAGAASLYPFNLVPPARMSQVAWVGIVLGAALAAQYAAPPGRRSLGGLLTIGSFTFLAAGLSGSQLRLANLPDMSIPYIWLMALVWAICVVVFVSARNPVKRWIPVTFVAFLSTVAVNPVQIGFGDIQSSNAAQAVRSLDNSLPPGTFLATDDLWTSGVLAANAIESLSGQQIVGPDWDRWRLVDPQDAFVNEWNRGASNVFFTWLDPGNSTTVVSPQGDVIVVNSDPCSQEMRDLGLGGLTSGRPLSNSCLTQRGTVSISGVERWLYLVNASGAGP